MTFSDTLMKPGGEDFLRELTEFMLNRIMEASVTRRINAEPHERSDERGTYRNGYRDRQYNTRPGTLELRIPKLREGSYFPSFLEARRLSDKASEPPGSVDKRRLHPQGGYLDPVDGDDRHLPQPGIVHLP